MSREVIEQIVSRAIGDAAFRRQLQTNPGAALRGFKLSADERSALTSRDPKQLSALGIDQRMSRVFVIADQGAAASVTAGTTDVSGSSPNVAIDAGDVSSAPSVSSVNPLTDAIHQVRGVDAAPTGAGTSRIDAGDVSTTGARVADTTTPSQERIDAGDVTSGASRIADTTTPSQERIDAGDVTSDASRIADTTTPSQERIDAGDTTNEPNVSDAASPDVEIQP